MKYIKKFENHSAYEAAESGLILPNVSLCVQEHDVHYNPIVSVTGVTLNKSTLSLSKGATETLVATVSPNNASNKSVTWSSSNDSVATVNNNGLVTAVGGGNVNITVTTVDGGYTAQCACSIIDPYNGHDYVEIGGIKWATMNIGATAVTDSGLYFQWGDVQGYTNDQVGGGDGKKYFGWADYKYGNGTGGPGATGMTKYNSADHLTTLQAADDAAQAAWGGNWRMPTKAEFQALSASTTTAWTTDYQGSGVAGLVLTSKSDSSVKLFFPAAGYCHNGSVFEVGSIGCCWSSSLNTSRKQYAYETGFGSEGVDWNYDENSRSDGYSVRGVAI